MTAQELYIKMLSELPFPSGDLDFYEVDHETFANVCQDIFDHKAPQPATSQRVITIGIGKNNGIYFKGIEIILKRE